MADTTGHSTAGRTIASAGTTSASAAITGPAGSFSQGDVGASVSGTGVPAGATIASVQSATAATLSAAATATGTVTLTVGPQLASSTGFTGWHADTVTQETSDTVTSENAGVTDPSRLADAATRDPEVTEH